MTPEQIADQIVKASDKYSRDGMKDLPKHACATPAMHEGVRRMLQAAYLSGISQMQHFIRGNDGAVTVEKVGQAVFIAGEALGYPVASPRKEGGQ